MAVVIVVEGWMPVRQILNFVFIALESRTKLDAPTNCRGSVTFRRFAEDERFDSAIFRKTLRRLPVDKEEE